MKKRVFSILTALCLCLSLLPTAAFAEGGAAPAESQQEQQEEVIPKADPKQPEEQPEVNPAEQPAEENGVPVALSAEDETVITLTENNISDYMLSGLTDGSYQLGENVTVESGSLEVKGTVTLDLNGHTLLFKDPELYYPPKRGQVNAGIRVYNSDSSENAAKYALTLCDTSTAKTGTLDVWGESMAESGEGLFVGQNGELTMTGGTITDSSETNPWGIGIGIIEGKVTMTGGKIENQTRCGVTLVGGTFEMSGDAVISNCGGNNSGGGIWIGGGTFTMSGGTIRNCNATRGGGVYVGAGTFIMTGGSIENCEATDESSAGIYLDGTLTPNGGTVENTVTVAPSGKLESGTETKFMAKVTNYGTISGGTFYGGLTDGSSSITGYIVTYMSSGSEYAKQVVVKDQAVTAPPKPPTKDYYQFVEWRTADGKAYDFNTAVTEDITLTAQWSTGLTGEGTAEDPYQLSSKDDLKLFRDMVNSGEYGLCAELTDDIDLSGENWTPIGNTTNNAGTDAYSGTFDGKGHTISGLNVTGNFQHTGLFGITFNATIQNLSVSGSVSASASGSRAGGIVGSAAYGTTIKNCSNHCDVVFTPIRFADGLVGGIAGAVYGSFEIIDPAGKPQIVYAGAMVIDCYNTGSVHSECEGSEIGGIAGRNQGTIRNCYSVGSVSCNGQTTYLGSIVGCIPGWSTTTGIVENCYYLDGAGLNAVGKNDKDGSITKTEPKSAAQFADGTVLALLKAGERGSNADPWADTCQYVDAASLTLPVFKNQNTHKHDLQRVAAKDATTSEEGNIEYWTCVCGKYFKDKDGTQEITRAETVIPKRHFSGGSSDYPITVPDKTENGSVSVSPKNTSKGSTVTITVTPDSGYVLETISVTDKNGNDLKLTDKGNGKYTFTMPGSKVEIKVTFMEDNSVLNFFYDVPNNAYYYEAVKWAAENGITGGVGNSLFAPNQPCTRAQIVTFLWRAAGSPVVNYAMDMADVAEDAYYAEAVRWALSEGITTGTGDGKFSPNATCTRAQSAVFLYRYMQSQGKGFTGAWMFQLPFTDVPEWCYEAVAWCYMKKVTDGTTATTFSPNDNCTRAQIVTMLYRLLAD